MDSWSLFPGARHAGSQNYDPLYIVGLINALEHERFEKLRYILYKPVFQAAYSSQVMSFLTGLNLPSLFEAAEQEDKNIWIVKFLDNILRLSLSIYIMNKA